MSSLLRACLSISQMKTAHYDSVINSLCAVVCSRANAGLFFPKCADDGGPVAAKLQ